MVTIQTGQRSTFNDTVGLKLDLSDLLPIIIDPYDVPLFQRMATKAPTVQAFKHEWLEEPLLPNFDTSGGDITSSATALSVSDSSKFKKRYVLKVESEQMLVTDIPDAFTLTVVRGYAGTVATAHVSPFRVDIIGYAVADGADPEPFKTTNRDPKFNLQQVYQELVEVTDLDQWTQIYGIKDKFSHEVEKLLKTLAIRAEKSMLFGARFEDSSRKTRTMGGLDFYIVTNAKNASGVPVDEDVINDRQQDIYAAGGQGNLLVASPTQKRFISALISASQRWFPRPNANETVGVAADEYISDFGRLELMMDRNIPEDTLYVLSTDLLSKVQGMPFTLENLAKTGTSRRAQIVGWFSLEVKAERRHAREFNLATS